MTPVRLSNGAPVAAQSHRLNVNMQSLNVMTEKHCGFTLSLMCESYPAVSCLWIHSENNNVNPLIRCECEQAGMKNSASCDVSVQCVPGGRP
ncbi:hypothetical protein JOB18_006431 [Solea senegalensis]|uniref:Uncharacterized protein n=1 Tax=Solea senegalensis TaxID=28829 RepID=A0AAV6SW40_SOLSE|nr:hypothetical protein JOB18_006431 [Solea senegalensis]